MNAAVEAALKTSEAGTHERLLGEWRQQLQLTGQYADRLLERKGDGQPVLDIAGEIAADVRKRWDCDDDENGDKS
jgi:hypothetical protein